MSTPLIPNLLTFPPSSDCENARWVLDHYGISFHENAHAAPPFVLFAMLFSGGRSIPFFKSQTEKINGLKPLIEHFENLADTDKKLILAGQTTETQALWDEFNIEMGGATVIWAYTNLLPHKAIMIEPLSLNCPSWERFFTRYTYFIPKNILWLLLKLNDKAAVKSLALVKQKFKKVDEMLADGREFLMGDHFSLVDIAFAVSGAPLVLPEGYGGIRQGQGPIPSYAQYPAEMKIVVDEMRETKAGQFVLKMYKEQRYQG